MSLAKPVQKRVIYGLAALTVLALLVAIFTVGIYQLGWDNSATRAFLKVIPLPAAIVDGKMISLAAVNDRLDAFQNAVSYQTEYEFNTGTGQETLGEQRSQILESLIENQLVKNLAEERGVSVDPEELDSYYRYLLPQFRILDEFASEQVREIFGWSEQEFKKKIVEPDLLQAKLLIALLRESKESEAYLEIASVKSQLDRGASFLSLSRAHSDDEESKLLGGELGFFAKQDLPPWFQDRVFPLAEGEFSDIIESPNGYHVFQTIFRDEQIDPQQVQLRHILVSDDPLSTILEQRRSVAKVYVQR